MQNKGVMCFVSIVNEREYQQWIGCVIVVCVKHTQKWTIKGRLESEV